jgi:hypothetical protein
VVPSESELAGKREDDDESADQKRNGLRLDVLGGSRINTACTGRGETIRTSDHLIPNQVRYQAALRPEKHASYLLADAWSIYSCRNLASIFRDAGLSINRQPGRSGNQLVGYAPRHLLCGVLLLCFHHHAYQWFSAGGANQDTAGTGELSFHQFLFTDDSGVFLPLESR